MADEAITLEALEKEAEEALKAEETPPSVEPEAVAKGAAPEDDKADEDDSASTEQAAHGGKKTANVPIAKLAKLREQRRTEREEKERLQKQNDELVKQLSLIGNAGQPKAALVPTLESCDYDESKYQTAIQAWNQQSLESKLQEIEQNRANQIRVAQFQQQLETDVQQHYQRVSDLGISPDDFIPAEKTVRDTFGDTAVDQMISAIGEGSERVVHHLGLNQAERDKVAQMIAQDPSGFKAIGYLGRLADKLATNPALGKISQAPAADRPLASSGSQSNGSAVLKQLERLNKLPNRDKFREYKRKLVANGQSDLLKKHGYM